MAGREMTHPDAGAAGRVAAEVVEALSALPFVRRVAVFGSLADGTADGWSDVDMFVACDDPGETCWSAAEAIRRAKPVQFYRIFSSDPQPAGRYWFADESPFQKLDVSFHSPGKYEALCEAGAYLGCAISTREVFARNGDGRRPWEVTPPRPVEVGERETEIGSWIYRLLRSTKGRLRGTPKGEDLDGDVAGLAGALNGVSAETIMGGGRIGELAYRVAELGEEVGRMAQGGTD